MSKQIVIASKASINEVLTSFCSKHCALIAITSPGENHQLDFGCYKDFLPALFVSFGDCSEYDPDFHPITFEQADEIARFILSWYDTVEIFICQCEAGLSRSSGVAAAIAYILKLDDTNIYQGHYPNAYVKSAIIHAYHRFLESH